MKKWFALILAAFICLSLSACVSQSKYDELATEKDTLSEEVNSLTKELKEVKEKTLIPQLKEEAKPVIDAINNLGEITLDKESSIADVKALYNSLSPDAQQYVDNYNIVTEAENKIKNLRASQSKEEKAQEYKQSCTEGYSYAELARNPDTYVGQKAKFRGEVIQVQESGNFKVFRVNVTQGKYSWTDTMYVTYTASDNESRVIEDDIITMYGEMQPLKTYQTVMGNELSIPAIDAKYIDIG